MKPVSVVPKDPQQYQWRVRDGRRWMKLKAEQKKQKQKQEALGRIQNALHQSK